MWIHFFLIPLDESELKYLLLSLKPNESPGIGGIPINDLSRKFGIIKEFFTFHN